MSGLTPRIAGISGGSGGSGGAVDSVFGRTGAVSASPGDYGSTDVANASAVAGATVTDALNTLNPHSSGIYNLGALGFALDGTDAAGNTTKFAALLTTLDDGTNYTGGIIEIPAGASVAYNSPLALRCNTVIRGLGGRSYLNASKLRPNGCAAIVLDGSVKGSGGWAFFNAVDNVMIWPQGAQVTGGFITLKDQYSCVFRDIRIVNDGVSPTGAAIVHTSGNFTLFQNITIYGPADYTGASYHHIAGSAYLETLDAEAHDVGVWWSGGDLDVINPYIERSRYAFKIDNSNSNYDPSEGSLSVQGGVIAAAGAAPCINIIANKQQVSFRGVRLPIGSNGYELLVLNPALKSNIRFYDMDVPVKIIDQGLDQQVTRADVAPGILFLDAPQEDPGRVPLGGTTDQVLAKASNADRDLKWTTVSGGGGGVSTSTTLTAGAGLIGGGDLSTNRSFAVGAGTGITVNADDVAVNFAGTGSASTAAKSDHTHSGYQATIDNTVDVTAKSLTVDHAIATITSSTSQTSPWTPTYAGSDVYVITALANALTINTPTGYGTSGYASLIYRITASASDRTITPSGYTILGGGTSFTITSGTTRVFSIERFGATWVWNGDLVAADIPTIAQSQVTNLTTDLAAKAALAGPTFTGVPAAPTASADTNTTQLATTAFVVGQAGTATPAALGTAAAGTSLKYARSDHIHAAVADATTSTKGLVELATDGENASGVVVQGNDKRLSESIVIACSDETTAITAGTGKVTFRMPYAFTLTDVRASLSTAQPSGGTLFTVDVNEGGTSILSTKLTFDNTEKTTTTATTARVISDTALADDAEITVDVDAIGDSGAKGLKVTLIGYRS